jgi:hypothetical protein
VLGHALYMKAIHGGKTKNDKIAVRITIASHLRRPARAGLLGQRAESRDSRNKHCGVGLARFLCRTIME